MSDVGTNRANLQRALSSGVVNVAVLGLCSLVALPFVIRTIGVDTYGAWAAVSTVLALAALADAGVRTEVSRRVAAALGEGDEQAMTTAVHQAVTVLAVAAAAIAAIGIAAAPTLVHVLFRRPVPSLDPAELTLLLRAMFVVLGLTLVVDGYLAALRGLQRTDVELRSLTLAAPIAVAVTVVAVAQGAGIWGLLFGSVAKTVVASAIQARALRTLLPGLRFRVGRLGAGAARSLLVLSGFALVIQVSEVVDSQWDKLVVTRFVGAPAAAAYEVGTLLVMQVRTLALTPALPLLAAMAELARRDDPAYRARVFDVLSRLTSALSGATLSSAIVLGPAFLSLWLGRELPGGEDVVTLFAIATMIAITCAPHALLALADGDHRLAAAAAGANVVVNGVASFALTARYGLPGALYGSMIGNVVGVVTLLGGQRRYRPEEWRRPVVLPLLTTALVAAGARAVGLGETAARSWPAFAGIAVVTFAVLGTLGLVSARLRPSDVRLSAS